MSLDRLVARRHAPATLRSLRWSGVAIAALASSRRAWIRCGKLLRVWPPAALYRRPATADRVVDVVTLGWLAAVLDSSNGARQMGWDVVTFYAASQLTWSKTDAPSRITP